MQMQSTHSGLIHELNQMKGPFYGRVTLFKRPKK